MGCCCGKSIGVDTCDAVLIGCNYYGTANKLEFAAKDVSAMLDALKKNAKMDIDKLYLGVEQESRKDFEKYEDAIFFNPTKQETMDVLKKVFEESKASGKYTYLHFSGHGCSIDDRDGDEKDGKDEAMLLCDELPIKDDDLNALFDKDTRLFATFDCCHSGSMLDLDKRKIGKIISISGCLDSQFGKEVIHVSKTGEKTTNGALTACFGKLMEVHQDGIFSMPLDALVAGIQERMIKFRTAQTCNVCTTDGVECIADVTGSPRTYSSQV